MNDHDTSALVTPASPALLDALAFPFANYGARFVDRAFWRPYAELIANAHGLPAGEIGIGEPGTFPAFILGRTHVVKLFGTPFDGLRCWAVERDVARLIAAAGLAIPTPGVVAAGVLSRDPDWRYLVTTFVPGEPFASVRNDLPAPDRLEIARALGRMLRGVHDLAIPVGTALGEGWADWTAFVGRQRRGVAERHRRWNVLPDRLLAGIDAYVAGDRVPVDLPPSLVHADLHAHHVIGAATGDGWAMRGVIDWGDARLADRFYELPALHLGLFHGDRAMLRAFLEGYDWPDFRAGAFVHRAMAMTLLHEFHVLEHVGTLMDLDAIASLDDLAAALWRV